MTSQKVCDCNQGRLPCTCKPEAEHGVQASPLKLRIDEQAKQVPTAVGEFAVHEIDRLCARLAKYEDAEGRPVVVLPDHERAKLVNALRDCAKTYAGTEQLRAQIATVLGQFMPLNSYPVSAGDDQAYDDEAELLTAEALGVGAGINPNATSIDDIFLTESAGGVDERATFEAAYVAEFQKERNESFTLEMMLSMREGDHYGNRPYVNGQWKGWQARAALSAPSHGEQVRPQLTIGHTYTSSRGFGRMTYLGETHDIDGWLPTFRTQEGMHKHYRHDQLPSALIEFAASSVAPSAGSQGGDV